LSHFRVPLAIVFIKYVFLSELLCSASDRLPTLFHGTAFLLSLPSIESFDADDHHNLILALQQQPGPSSSVLFRFTGKAEKILDWRQQPRPLIGI
jgi:hypothetical protein